MLLTIPPISKLSPRASPFSLPPATVARLVVTIASPRLLTASPPTLLLLLPTTLPSVAPISATLTPAPMPPTGTPATPLLSVLLFLTFQKFLGMTPAPARSSPLTWATAQPTAQRAFATIRSSAPYSRLLSPVVAAPADAQPEPRPPATS